MPYTPKRKNIPKDKLPREQQISLDLGRLQPPEYISPKQAKSMVRDFLDLDAALFFGVGPETKKQLDAKGIKSVGQVLNHIKHYKDPTHSEVYQLLNPQAKKQVKEMLNSPLIQDALKNYKGPLGPRDDEKDIQPKQRKRIRRRTPQDISWWRRLLKALHIIS